MTVNCRLPARHAQHFCLVALLALVLFGGAFSRALASQAVALNWNPSPDADVYAYNVYYGSGSGDYTNFVTCYYVTDVVISGLAEGATYYFAVSAVNYDGVESDLSTEASYVVPVPVPLVLQPQRALGAQAVELAWNPSTDYGGYGYKVYYGTESGVYNNSTTFYYATDGVVSGLTGGTTNYFAVSAIDVYGNESPLSNEAAYVVPVPVPPVLQAQRAPVALAAELTWNPSTDYGGYGYKVYYGTESGVYNNSAIFYYATNGVVSGLTGGTTNYFAVSAFDVYGGESPLSNEASYVVPFPDRMVLQTQTFTDESGQRHMQITARAAVNALWEVDYSTDLQNWSIYSYGYGAGYGDDVNVDVLLDPNEPQMFFRAINY